MLIADQPESIRITESELWQALDLTRPGLEEVRAAAARRDRPVAAEAWARYFAQRRRPCTHLDRDTWASYLRSNFPAVADAMIATAEKIAAGNLSHGPARLPVKGVPPTATIDWLHNPTKDTNYVSLVGSQWFMNSLGRAYLLTGDERFVQTFAWLFESWFDNQEAICRFQGGLGFDPIYHAYYPGVRERILVDNYYCLKESPALTPALQANIMRQILADARFLWRQEQRYRAGNQQVAALVGLGIIGLAFPEFWAAPKWIERAETLMARHLHEDVFADGGHNELCTQYHKTCLRDLTYMALTSEANGRPSPLLQGNNGKAFERAIDWLAKLIMPTGETPPLHSAVFSTDHAVYTLFSAAHFHRADHAWLAARFWRRGQTPNQKAPVAHGVYLLAPALAPSPVDPGKPPAYRSVHLKQSGVAVMRTGWQPDDRYLVFQYGWANSGHAYPAALSFVLEMNGDLVATQPGSPRSYRDPAYATCHSTAAHQAVTIDGTSYPTVRGIAPGGRLDFLADLSGLWAVSAYHEGYKKSAGVTVRRLLIVFKDGPILVLDRLAGGVGHTAQWHFHTPLPVKVEADNSVSLLGCVPYRLMLADGSNLPPAGMRRHWAAVLPSQCQPGDCGAQVTGLTWEKQITGNETEFAVALFEHDGELQREDEGFRLTQADRAYLVLPRDARSVIETEEIRAEARLLVLEKRDDRAVRAWVCDGIRLTCNGRDLLKAETPVTREIDLNL